MTAYFSEGDSLGFYLAGAPPFNSDPALSLGGARSDYAVRSMDVIVRRSVPHVLIEHVSGANTTGTGYIRATSTTELAYTEPGGTTGDSSELLPGATALLIGDGAKFIRVSRESEDVDDLNGDMQVELAPIFNNLLGMSNVTNAQRIAGVITYRAMFLFAHGSCGVTDIKVWTENGDNLEVAWEVPVSSTIQEIADENTAPLAVAWNAGHDSGTGLTLASLAQGADYGLWIKRTISALSAASGRTAARVYVQWTCDGETYIETLQGLYRIEGVAGYNLYVGEDADPDFDAAPAATSATLPFTYIPTPPLAGTKELRMVCRQFDAYGIETHNVKQTRITIDNTGAEVVTPPTGPASVQLMNMTGGNVKLLARYYDSNDDAPADTWRVYLTTDGTDPDPAVDTPTEYAMTEAVGSMVAPAYVLNETLGPYPFGMTLKVVVCTYNSVDAAESTNDAVTELEVSRPPLGAETMLGAFYGATDSQRLTPTNIDTETVYDVTYNIRTVQGEGFTELWHDATLVWRLKYSKGGAYAGLWTTYAFIQADISGASNNDPIDAISPTQFYVTVNGVRRMLIDVSAETISFSAHVTSDDLVYGYSTDTIDAQSNHTLFQVWSAALWNYATAMSLDENGKLAHGVPWRQRATTGEFL